MEAPCRTPVIPRGGAGRRLAVWMLIGALALTALMGPARAAAFKEYQLKAVFL
ncbi:MAG: hypothetical protein GY859_08940, partial [Desulfobacterales bacterium]|nr:hypothetical protein [Desulfobacterales bacterium]